MQWPRLKIVRHKTEDKLAIDHEGYWWDPEYHEAETYVPLALLEQVEERLKAEADQCTTGEGAYANGLLSAADLLRSMREGAEG